MRSTTGESLSAKERRSAPTFSCTRLSRVLMVTANVIPKLSWVTKKGSAMIVKKLANCSFDPQIYDGYDDTFPELSRGCGMQRPRGSLRSNGNVVYIKFLSRFPVLAEDGNSSDVSACFLNCYLPFSIRWMRDRASNLAGMKPAAEDDTTDWAFPPIPHRSMWHRSDPE